MNSPVARMHVDAAALLAYYLERVTRRACPSAFVLKGATAFDKSAGASMGWSQESSMQIPDGWQRLGTFTLGALELVGELVLDSERTALRLFYESPTGSRYDSNLWWGTDLIKRIVGTLHDGRQVTLVDCLLQGTRSTLGGKTALTIYPHYVIHGPGHLDPAAPSITQIQVEIEDAATLFYDFDAFGVVVDEARPLVQTLIEHQRASMARFMEEHGGGPGRSIPDAGPDAMATYFSGRRELAKIDTCLGTILVQHNPLPSFGGPDGTAIGDRITISLDFAMPRSFADARNALLSVVHFFSLLLGRQQNLMSLHVSTIGKEHFLDVYWSSPPRRQESSALGPHPAELLIDPLNDETEFRSILPRWLRREPEWKDARERFTTCFYQQNVLTTDRLVAAANMFDILPVSAVPTQVEIGDDLREARDVARASFLALPNSPERDSVLGVLGHIGKPTVKRRIRHRARPIVAAIGNSVPKLIAVLDAAVNCRNHYVHGTDPECNYVENFIDTAGFFTDALEFVFGASDLIEDGWNIEAWHRTRGGRHHPFGDFTENYRARLARLEALLPLRSE
jgi:hypothetical protein